MPEITSWEQEEVDRANASGRTPVVFVHGLWLLSSSWKPWRELFESSGYTTLAPGWPDDPLTVEEARENPDAFAHKMVQQVTDHYLAAIEKLDLQPVVIGHSFGGLIAQKIAGTGAAAVTVAIDNAPFKGVLPVPLSSIKSAAPVLGNPANRGKAIALTFEQFTYGWANNLEEDEAQKLYDEFHVPASGVPLFQAVVANFNPFHNEVTVDVKNPDRGPLLVIGGAEDNTVPLSITKATFKQQEKNPGVTEFLEIPGRGHSLTIDHGWAAVAQEALAFVDRFAPQPE
ncbi:alpha/beta hydrolase [Gryllotalpicola protaetiae]|uniref:Alpha/beta hydrolase n=1 Tax=Gryllotalpicola protaetiae TaxID=2419771 RepID=A0A387BK57_9MICO|nr:alpha/beta hydrolase [Gryllotalpicola protaetiae]AYG04535.1 alpha/beta hydrolase [Gryllotalpicola protaetiae]